MMEQRTMPLLIDQIRGVSYKPTDLHDSLNSRSITLLRANNIDDGRINFDDVVFVDRKCVSESQILRKGDILICASSGSRNLVGKAAQVDFDGEYTFGAFCKVVRPKLLSDAGYIGMFFQSPIYRRTIAEKAQGININNIRGEHIDDMMVRWPNQVDRQIAVETYRMLIDCIRLRQRQLSTLDNLIKARFVEMFGDPEYNNQGLPIRKLSELCNVGSSKRIYQEEQTIDGVPFWRISDLVAKMDTGNVDSSLYIPESRYEELKIQGLVPKPGDILVTSRGTLGRCYIIAPDDRFYFQDGMISWLSNYSDEITPLYIRYLFDMSGFRKQIDGLQAGSTVAYLSIAMLKKLNVMLPARKLQKQFAAFVSQVDKSKSVVQASIKQAQLLLDSMMQQYFG